MNSDQRLSYLHLMNKAAESEDRQSYFYYLKLAEQTLHRDQSSSFGLGFGFFKGNMIR